MVVALGVLLAYQYVLHLFYPNWKPGQETQQQAPATTQVATSQPATTQATTRSVGVTTAPAQGTWQARGDGDGAPVSIGSIVTDDKAFVMGLEVLRKGAAINSVTLNQFRKTAEDKHT